MVCAIYLASSTTHLRITIMSQDLIQLVESLLIQAYGLDSMYEIISEGYTLTAQEKQAIADWYAEDLAGNCL